MKQSAIPQTAKGMFALLRRFFAQPIDDKERIKAWDVLSALRGPDTDNFTIKGSTTAVIRYHLLGQGIEDLLEIDSFADNKEKVRERLLLDDHIEESENHFNRHAYRAFVALGLHWDKDNSKKRNRGKRRK